MILKLVINSSCLDIQLACAKLCLETGITLDSYNDEYFKDRKKAISIKAHWGTRLTPFAVLEDESGKCIKAFYSDNDECVYENIERFINNRPECHQHVEAKVGN